MTRSQGKTLRSTVLALGLFMVPSAMACDPSALDAELARVCDGALAPARGLVMAVHAEATAPEQAAIHAALARAQAACDHGDPVAGAAEAVRLARLAGRIEARLGSTPPIWDPTLASLEPGR